MFFKKIFYCFILIFITNCAIPTPYQKLSTMGGYSEQKLETNKFFILFGGNGFTSLEVVKDYALLRSAEVAKENDFKFFEIEEQESENEIKTTNYCQNGICSPMQTNKPLVKNKIICYKYKPETKGTVYDSDDVIFKLKSKYSIK